MEHDSGTPAVGGRVKEEDIDGKDGGRKGEEGESKKARLSLERR